MSDKSWNILPKKPWQTPRPEWSMADRVAGRCHHESWKDLELQEIISQTTVHLSISTPSQNTPALCSASNYYIRPNVYTYEHSSDYLILPCLPNWNMDPDSRQGVYGELEWESYSIHSQTSGSTSYEFIKGQRLSGTHKPWWSDEAIEAMKNIKQFCNTFDKFPHTEPVNAIWA